MDPSIEIIQKLDILLHVRDATATSAPAFRRQCLVNAMPQQYFLNRSFAKSLNLRTRFCYQLLVIQRQPQLPGMLGDDESHAQLPLALKVPLLHIFG